MKNPETLNLGFSVDAASLNNANKLVQSITSSIGEWIKKMVVLEKSTGVFDSSLQKSLQLTADGYDNLDTSTGKYLKNGKKIEGLGKILKGSNAEYTKYNKKLKESGKSLTDFARSGTESIKSTSKNQKDLKNSLKSSMSDLDDFTSYKPKSQFVQSLNEDLDDFVGFDSMSRGLNKFDAEQEDILSNLNSSLDGVCAQTGKMNDQFDESVLSLASFGDEIQENEKKSKNFSDSLEDTFSGFSDSVNSLKENISNIPGGLLSAAKSVGSGIGAVASKMNSMQQSMVRGFSSVTSTIKDSALNLSNLFPPLAALGAATGGILSIKGAFESAWNAGQELEKMTVKMTNRFGSSDYAKKATGFINDMSQQYGIAKDDLASYTDQLGEMGLSIDKVNFKGVLNAAEGPGKDLQSTMSAMTALAKGGDFQSFTESFGNTIDPAALQESLAGATTYQERMQKTADFLDKQFAGNSDRMKNSTEGQIASISGFFEKLQQTISGSGAFKAMQDVLTNIFKTIEENKDSILAVGQVIGSMMGTVIKFIGGLMGNISGSMGGAKDVFKSIADGIKNVFYPIVFILGFIGMKIGKIISKVFRGDMKGATVEFGQLVAEVLGFLGNMINKVLDFIPGLLKGLRGLSPSIGKAVQEIVNSIVTFASGLPGKLTKIIDELFPTLGQLIKDVLPPILNGAIDIITDWLPQIPKLLWSGFVGAFNLLLDIGSILPGIFNNLLNKLSAAFSEMILGLGTAMQKSDNPIVQFFGKIVTWAGDFDKIKIVLEGIGIVIGGIVAYMAGAWAVEMAKSIAQWVTQKAEMLAHYAAQTIAFVKEKAQMVANFAIWVGQNAAILAGWIAQGAVMAANAIVAAAMWVATLGPIALIIGGLALLAGGFVLLYKKCDWFRNLVDLLWEGIKVGAAFVWEAVKKYFNFIWDLIKTVFGFLKSYVMLIVDNVVAVFKGLYDTFSKLFTGDFKGALESFLGIFKNIFSNISKFFGDTFESIKSVFTNLFSGETLSTIWNAIKDFFMSIPSKIGDLLSGGFKGLKNLGESIFGEGFFDPLIRMFKGFMNFILKAMNHIPGINIPLLYDDSGIKDQAKQMATTVGQIMADPTKSTDFTPIIKKLHDEVETLTGDQGAINKSAMSKAYESITKEMYNINTQIGAAGKDLVTKQALMEKLVDYSATLQQLPKSNLSKTGEFNENKSAEDFVGWVKKESGEQIKSIGDSLTSVAKSVLDKTLAEQKGNSVKDAIVKDGKVHPMDPKDQAVVSKDPGFLESLGKGDVWGAIKSIGSNIAESAKTLSPNFNASTILSSIGTIAQKLVGQEEISKEIKTSTGQKVSVGNLGFKSPEFSKIMQQYGGYAIKDYSKLSDDQIKEGAAWCASFVKASYGSVLSAVPELWDQIKDIFNPNAQKTLVAAGNSKFFELSKTDPKVGSLIGWSTGDPVNNLDAFKKQTQFGSGHLGLVSALTGGGGFKTVEGNSGKDGEGREGIRVSENVFPKAGGTFDKGKLKFIGFANPKFDDLLKNLNVKGKDNNVDTLGDIAVTPEGEVQPRKIIAKGSQKNPGKDFVMRPGEEPLFFEPTDTLFGVRKSAGLESSEGKTNVPTANQVSINFGPNSIVLNSVNPTYDAKKMYEEMKTLMRREQGRIYGTENKPY